MDDRSPLVDIKDGLKRECSSLSYGTMPDSDADREYDRILDVLASGGREGLANLSREVAGFPHGVDGFLGRRWIMNAIDCGSKLAVEWMIRQGVDLSFCDDTGYTVLHAALELRRNDDRHEVLKMLLAAGAPVNAFGPNSWTPAHMAAAREDIAALKLLIEHNADLTIRTEIDEYATPLEEARALGKEESVRFLERYHVE